MTPEIAERELARLHALDEYQIMDTAAEREFDALTKLASFICGTPISLISLVDERRQWFKSHTGLEIGETPREVSFCQHAILGDGIFEIPNAQDDPRFFDNPLVTGSPNIRFYAGSPLVSSGGFKLGTLCVIDTVPRTLTAEQRLALKTLGDEVIARFELRRQGAALREEKKSLEDMNTVLQQKNRELDALNKEKNQILAVVTHDLKNPVAQIIGLSGLLKDSCENMTEEQCDDINRIYEAGWKANEMIDRLLGAHSVARARR